VPAPVARNRGFRRASLGQDDGSCIDPVLHLPRLIRMLHPISPAELSETWRTLAAQLRSLGGDAQARTLEFCADQLIDAMLHRADELLSLQRAADESGYSLDHLSRLLRDGKIPNAGRRAKPLIRRRDLPVKSSRRKAAPCASKGADYRSDRLFRDIIHSKLGDDDAQD
jgi:hypothetical protein